MKSDLIKISFYKISKIVSNKIFSIILKTLIDIEIRFSNDVMIYDNYEIVTAFADLVIDFFTLFINEEFVNVFIEN